MLRGMDRDHDRRWPDLQRLRDALLPFVATGLKITDQAVRLSAYLADTLLLLGFQVALTAAIAASLGQPEGRRGEVGGLLPALLGLFGKRLAFLAYFAAGRGTVGGLAGQAADAAARSAAPARRAPGRPARRGRWGGRRCSTCWPACPPTRSRSTCSALPRGRRCSRSSR